MDSVQQVRDFGAFSPKWDVFLKTFSLNAQRCMQKRRQKECNSQKWWIMASSRHNNADIELTETATMCTKAVQV